MAANDGIIPDELPVASALAGAVANATSDPTKEKILPANIIEMLTNSTLREEVMPLLKKVLDEISKIDGLDTAINDVFKTKTNDNKELGKALKTLQDKMESIYFAKSQNNEGTSNGGKRRKSKKRNYYKKRRATKRR
jgi:hypothetical protein